MSRIGEQGSARSSLNYHMVIFVEAGLGKVWPRAGELGAELLPVGNYCGHTYLSMTSQRRASGAKVPHDIQLNMTPGLKQFCQRSYPTRLTGGLGRSNLQSDRLERHHKTSEDCEKVGEH